MIFSVARSQIENKYPKRDSWHFQLLKINQISRSECQRSATVLFVHFEFCLSIFVCLCVSTSAYLDREEGVDDTAMPRILIESQTHKITSPCAQLINNRNEMEKNGQTQTSALISFYVERREKKWYFGRKLILIALHLCVDQSFKWVCVCKLLLFFLRNQRVFLFIVYCAAIYVSIITFFIFHWLQFQSASTL